MIDLQKNHRHGGGDDDTKGDDNKAAADPGDISRLPDDVGERVGHGNDDEVEGHAV